MHAHLSAVVDLVVALRSSRRLVRLAPSLQRIVQYCCVYPLSKLVVHLEHGIQHLRYVRSVGGRYELYGRKVEDWELEPYPILYGLHLVRHAFEKVYLVQYKDDALASSHYEVCYLLVLVSKPFNGVNYKKDDIGLVNRLYGSVHGVVLHILLDLRLSSYSSRVKDCELLAFVMETALHYIPCRACNWAYDGQVKACQKVCERTLACVWLSKDGKLKGIGLEIGIELLCGIGLVLQVKHAKKGLLQGVYAKSVCR